MAINVNTVYQTALFILNKEQRGYLTPSEFNNIASQVQLEIFEQYVEDLNQQLRVPTNSSQYGDRRKNIEENISIFEKHEPIVYSTTYNCFLLPTDVHRIGTIMYKEEQEAQRISRKEFLHLNMSKLTKPSTKYPVYIQKESIGGYDPNNPQTAIPSQQLVDVYPEIIKEDMSLSYIRKPKNVRWGYTVGSQGQYIYDPSPFDSSVSYNTPSEGSTNFEISNTDQTSVILKVLVYAGVVIRDPQIVQAAATEVQKTEQNQKS